MENNDSKKNERIEELEIRLNHISNEHEVIKKHYEKTTGEYYDIVEELTKANKQLQQEIAERKKVEKELNKVHEELELRIHERTAELTQVNEDLHNDITDRKKTEKALAESEEKFRELVDLLPETIWETDLEGNLIYVSQKIYSMSGYTRKELKKGCNVLQFLIDEDKERAKKNISEIIRGNKIGSNEYTILKKDGSPIPVLIHSNMIVKDGKPIGLRGIIVDISERIKLEEQIQIRQRMDSLGTLAGGIAHDFNNILACIMGYLDLLKLNSHNFLDFQNDYVEEAYQSCQRAAGLIKEFQSLSIGPLQETSSVDIYEIAHEVFTLLERTTDKIIVKKNELKPGQMYVKGKADQIHHVLLNLGTNAVNAIEEKETSQGGYIKISAQEQFIAEQDPTGLPEGNYIHILFEDTGTGMSKEVKRRAFEPLFSTKMRGSQKGQGLGLTMVYNIIIRNHQGYIDIDTEEGNGTTLHIYLPKADAIEYSEPVQPSTPIGGQETILIIEDEDPIRNLTAELLTQYGYTIVTASDGLAGLEAYKEKQDVIDLILLDLTIPKMSGKSVLEKIIELNPDVKVVISSGHSEEEMKKYNHHAKGFISKPYNLKDLVQYIRSVLDN